MSGPRSSGHVAHCPPGAVILTPRALALLAKHLRARREPDDFATSAVVRDIQRLSHASPVSRDVMAPRLVAEVSSEVDTRSAATLLGISPAGVRKRIHRQQLSARFDGTQWWIARAELERP